ncbi:MAG: hypothetical protein QNJ22_11445 [Desulfosarcinaceae bacterium]|nr:hypothetical protein [Desulfosarcinaceae bacterium]
MMRRYGWLALVLTVALLAGCATKQDIERLEGKVDLLILATNRTTLDEIFGDQATEITRLVNDLDAYQKRRFENLQQEYTNGTMAVETVRQKMLSILGNNDRIVSTQRGIYIRNLQGAKLKAIATDTKIVNCQLLDVAEIPNAIQRKRVLKRYSWGRGELNGEPILFPWELTISAFTKEVAEHTARRTAQEFIKMGGEKKWQRPIKIQISTEKDDPVKITTDETESEIYLEYENREAEGGAAADGSGN